MKLNLQKFLMAAATVGAVILAGCSDGGSDPAQVASANATVIVGTTTQTTSTNLAKALTGTSIPVTTSVSGTATTSTFASIPAGSTLTFTAIPAGADASAISGFALTTPTTSYTGSILAGSCIFKIAEPVTLAGQTLTISPCTFSVATSQMTAGTTADKTVTVTLGTYSQSTTKSVTLNTDGTIVVGGVSTGVTVSLVNATGATGGTGASN